MAETADICVNNPDNGLGASKRPIKWIIGDSPRPLNAKNRELNSIVEDVCNRRSSLPGGGAQNDEYPRGRLGSGLIASK